MFRPWLILFFLLPALCLHSQKAAKSNHLIDSANKYEFIDWSLSYYYAKMALQTKNSGFTYEDTINLNTIIDTYYQKRNMLDSAFSINKQSLRLATMHQDKQLTAFSLSNMAGIYELSGNHYGAIDMYKKALKMLTELKDTLHVANTNYNLSLPFGSLNMNDSALFYTNRAFENYKKLGNYSGMASCYNSYGSDMDEKGNYAEAIKFYKLEIENFKLSNETAELVIPYQNLADTYLKQKDYINSKIYLDMAMNLAVSQGSKTDIFSIADTYSKYYEAIGDFKMANHYMRRYYEGKDTVLNNELKTELSDLKSEFDRENSEYLLTIKQLESEKNLKSKDTIKWILIISSFFFIIILVLSVNRYRSKQRSYLKLNEYKNQLTLQKEKIEETQKDIIDSINYAKRIQSAVMAMEEDILNYFPESFLIYKPKNIVAGDFYFFEVTDTHVFYAAADCTGHGVPGALVSMVCANALTRCVKEFGLTDPGKILDKTRELILETFNKSGKDVKDGMDISFCCFEKSSLLSGSPLVDMQWAGANNSVWYVEEGKLTELKADKQPIGHGEQRKPFVSHQLSLKRGSAIYLFTDGFVDQFGGEKGKKFKYRQLEEQILAAHTLSMKEQKDRLEQTFNNWKGELEQVDDVLVIGIRV